MREIKKTLPFFINRKKTGQSLVELMVSLCFLLFLLGGMVDLGRAIITYFILQDAAEEGLVYGTTFPTDTTHIRQRILDNISNPTMKSSISTTITIQNVAEPFTSIQVCAGKTMKIVVQYPFTFTMPFMKPFGSLAISTTASGVILIPPCT